MIERKHRIGRCSTESREHTESVPLGRLQSIAQELEDIKNLVNQIEARGSQNIDKSDLDAIENRLNILEFELFYDSLN